MKAKVTFWSSKGYGFLRTEQPGEDIFVHVSALDNVDELEIGDVVTFDAVFDNARGKTKADKVRVL